MTTTKNDLIEIAGLWSETSDSGTRYLSGKLGGTAGPRVLVFKNERKKNPREPDYRVYLAPPRPRADTAEGSPKPPADGLGL